jgi:membrane-associated HD superfamily phosphohydrolase
MSDLRSANAEQSMRKVLEELLEADEDITARAVARLHPTLSAASSITRDKTRSDLLTEYKHRQQKMRAWRDRLSRRSGADIATSLADKDIKIATLEKHVEMLTASHLAMLRAVGEIGGFKAWSRFYEDFRKTRDELAELGAIPSAAVTALTPSSRP